MSRLGDGASTISYMYIVVRVLKMHRLLPGAIIQRMQVMRAVVPD